MSFGSRFGFGRSQVVPQQTQSQEQEHVQDSLSDPSSSNFNVKASRPAPLSPAALVAVASSIAAQPLSPPDTIKSHSPPPLPTTHFQRPTPEEQDLNFATPDRRSFVEGGARSAFQGLAMRALQTEREKQATAPQTLRRGLSYTTQSRNSISGGFSGAEKMKTAKKWLVLVRPPNTIPHSPPPPQVSGFAHGYGATGRFSGGILLPLQQTLPAQLALIAREFSLPSVGGVSLYLCLPSNDVQPAGPGYFSTSPSGSESAMKPRLVEEIWTMLWANYLDEESSGIAEGVKGVYGLPIAGRLEFDIDPRKARWLSTWTNPSLPERAPPSHNVPLRQVAPESTDHSRSSSLDERFEIGHQSFQASPLQSRSVDAGRVPLARGRRPLSLLHRTNSSTHALSQYPTELARATAISAVAAGLQHESTNLLSDSGYGSSPLISTHQDTTVPSPTRSTHAPLSVCTDDDYWPPTPPSPDRLPSPDIGHRTMSFTPSALGFDLPIDPYPFVELVLPTFAALPTAHPSKPKAKLIERDWEIKMRPIWEISGTPTPEVLEDGAAKSVEAQEKVLSEANLEFRSQIRYPRLDIYQATYPNFDLFPSLKPVILQPLLSNSFKSSVNYPILDIYPTVYPHFKLYAPLKSVVHVPFTNPSGLRPTEMSIKYPNLDIYPPTYPHFDLYPSLKPVVEIPLTNPRILSTIPAQTQIPSSYPHNLSFIYPPVYPHVREILYPALAPNMPSKWSTNLSPRLQSRYPYVFLYRPSYPFLDIYPALPGTLPTPSATPKHIPPPLIFIRHPSLDQAWPDTPPSPDRLESASLESRVLGSAEPADGPPELQFGISNPAGLEWSDQHAREPVMVGRDNDIKMRSLADVSELSPLLSNEEEVPVRQYNPFELTAEEEADFEGVEFSEGGDGDEDEDEDDEDEDDSLPDNGLPRATFSSLFEPPPSADPFIFDRSPSPTLNANELNSSLGVRPLRLGVAPPSPSDGDDLPFIISPRLGAALDGFDTNTNPYDPQFPEDDDADSDEDGVQYVIMGSSAETTRDLQTPSPINLSTDPVLFTFPKTTECDDLSAAVAQFICEAQVQSIQRRGRFCIALSGGSMVGIIAEGLVNDDRVDWSKWEVFFVDERLVPFDHPDSTFNAYDQALFSRVPIPAWQIHSIKALLSSFPGSSVFLLVGGRSKC